MLISVQLVFLGFAIFILLISISNSFFFYDVSKFSKTKKNPFVSILVPARNEENNIKKCINSLLNQNYSNFELLVLDDNSEDNTLKIIKSIKNKKLKIIHGKPLPNGWVGKNWACHQLFKKSKGELILFTDADTVHKHNSLSSSINAMISKNAEVLSLYPKQEINTFGEKLIMPISWWSMFSVYSIFLSKFKYFTQHMIGQFMLFKRKTYEKIKGHKGVKSLVIDDFNLAHNLKKKNINVLFLNGSKVLSCRMYDGFMSAFNGFKRLLFSAFNYRVLPYFWVWFWLSFQIYIPFSHFSIINIITISITFLAISLTMINLDFNPIYALLVPITYPIVFFTAITSLFSYFLKETKWKGRNIQASKIKLI